MSRDFDHNEMQALAALKRWRYERSGGGGTHQVYTTSKAWFDAHWKDKSEIERKFAELRFDFSERMSLIWEHYRLDRLTAKGGFYDGDHIPF